jgi:hypothetical protein
MRETGLPVATSAHQTSHQRTLYAINSDRSLIPY